MKYKLFFVLSFILMFLNLGNIYLWHDEASTAMLGKNTAEFGYPKIYDGKNYLIESYKSDVNLTKDRAFSEDSLAWESHSLLPYYVCALSFKFFGYSTLSARILFTLIGFLSLFLIYKLYSMLYKEQKIVNLAMIILFASTFFFTFSRQCRYYSLALFFTVALLINYINLLRRNKIKDIALFSICGALLYHTLYLPFFIVFLTLTIHFIFFTDTKKNIKKLAFSYLLIAITTLPWFLYSQPWRFGISSSIFDLTNALNAVLFILKSVNYHYPLLLLILLPALLYKVKSKNSKVKNENVFSDRLLFIFILLPILFLLLSPTKMFRYLYYLSPLFFLFCSRLFYLYKDKTKTIKIISIIVLILLLTTNLLSITPLFVVGNVIEKPLIGLCEKFAPADKTNRCSDYIGGSLDAGKVKFPIFYYIYEITHDYNGPNEGVIIYLNENAKKDDVVWSYFSGFYIQYYTNLRVMGLGEYDKYLNNSEVKPDWIVYRRKANDYAQPLVDYAKNNNYIPIELSYPDFYYENRPEISGHKFWTDKTAKNLIIYKKPQ